MLAFLTPTTPVWALLAIFTVYGIRVRHGQRADHQRGGQGMPRDRAGAASAVTSTSRQVGVSIGVALCGSVAGAALASVGADFLDATRPLWFIGVALGLVVAGLAVFSIGAGAAIRRAPGAAHRGSTDRGRPCRVSRWPIRSGG